MFDRIVFYVSPSCGNLSAKHLRRAMQNFSFQFDERTGRGYKSLRQRMLMRRRIFICTAAAVVVTVVVTTAIILL